MFALLTPPKLGSWRTSSSKMTVQNQHVFGLGVAASVGRGLQSIIINLLSLVLYLIPRRGQPVRKKARHELHPLAYLDALRGYLALVIFTAHTMPRHWEWIPDSVLSIPWLQFPFRGGFASLDIFFWISGYAVTYRIVGFMQAKRSDKLLDALASSIFRRYFRLFLPILPVTFVTVMTVSIGLAVPPEDRAKLLKDQNPLWFWVKDSAHFLNPFTHILGYWTGETGSTLVDPFWTLSAEFRSSMIMFLFCTGTCKMSSRNRKILIWLCFPPFMAWQAQLPLMAFLGMWFAECRQQKRRDQEAQGLLVSAASPKPDGVTKAKQDDGSGNWKAASSSMSWSATMKRSLSGYSTGLSSLPDRRRNALLVLMFLYSFIVLKDPYETDKKTLFPHNYLNLLVPEHWHAQMRMHMHLCIGAFLMLYPLDQLYTLQWPLLTPFSQYLGELSFGIYAVHFPVRWIVWEPRYVKWQIDRYGDEAFDHFWIAFPGWLGMAVLVLWAADLFRRLDMQVVRFCKYLETSMFE